MILIEDESKNKLNTCLRIFPMIKRKKREVNPLS